MGKWHLYLQTPPMAEEIQEFFFNWYPVFGVFFMALLLYIFLKMTRGMMGTTKPETVKASHTKPVLWDEVQGVDAAKDELVDVTAWLREPERFAALGAQAPRGVLLYGPPGTGKTMLARAVAAQAGVDFYAASGSSFVEMFVGRGAARIRRLFKEARKSGRAVIFIDELDAIGGRRSSGGGDGGSSEREQALNQLLVELDGFEKDPGMVIVIAASNYVDKLDRALLRPGRFDRQVLVSPPDRDGREAILRSHAKGKPLAPDLDLTDVARKTTGMTGAELANALNEGAIIAGRAGRSEIRREDLDEALLRQSLGSQQSRRITEKERLIVAYHEAGHALCFRLVSDEAPEMLSIVPRGTALGFVAPSVEEDRYMASREELLDDVVTSLGGRAAEEEVFGEGYSGVSSDFAHVYAVCTRMITEFGMGVALDHDGPPPIATPIGQWSISDATRRDVDLAAMTLAREAYRRARALLAANRGCLDELAAQALDRETLSREEMEEIFAEQELHSLAEPRRNGVALVAMSRDMSASAASSFPRNDAHPE
jgi:cell division protease FtsH